MTEVKTIGIVGAGKLGIVLAQLALKAGYQVVISSSSDPRRIALTVEVLAPGAVAATTAEVAARADVIILALPLGKFRQLNPADFADKLVIDAMNYWWEVDGERASILPDNLSSSQAIQSYLSDSRVVKTFSHMGYHDLHGEARPKDQPERKALAVAGDNSNDVAIACQLVDSFGFDPLKIGNLASGRRLEPGGPVFGANLPIKDLEAKLN